MSTVPSRLDMIAPIGTSPVFLNSAFSASVRVILSTLLIMKVLPFSSLTVNTFPPTPSLTFVVLSHGWDSTNFLKVRLFVTSVKSLGAGMVANCFLTALTLDIVGCLACCGSAIGTIS